MNGTPTTLDNFLKQGKQMLYRRKERITRSDELEFVYYLNQGYVRIYTISKDGSELTLHIFSPSSIFPILWEEDKNSTEYYFESLTPVEVFRFERKLLQKLISQKAETSLEIIKQLTFFSKSTIRKLELKIFADANQQVIASILELAQCFGGKNKENMTISYWFTHHDIASLAGLSRERVTIEINNLINKKLILYNDHFIQIPKPELLQSELKS